VSGIGWTEIFLVALILLIFVGPKRLPDLFGKLAWLIAQLRSASRDLRNQISEEMTELNQVKSDFTAEMKAQTDALYAEARQLDDEYKALEDDVMDAGSDVKKELGALPRPEDADSGTGDGKTGDGDKDKKEMKG
jgi:sec-independent protein translocase protein TatB